MTASAFPHRPEFAPEPARRFDLDWLRIIAFGLLIFYHIGMYFVTWPWHVKSVHAGPAIQPLMLLTSPWRLALLFLIAGVATRYMAGKFARDGQSRGAMARKRSARLLLPLVFGMLVVVPPQTYAEIVGKLGFDEGFAAFYAKYIGFHDGWQVDGARLIVPTWNHLWFVAYLWVYTMIVLAALPLLHGAPARRLGLWLQRWLAGRGLVVWPALLLIALRLTLRPVFGQTHALFDDWYLHAVYFSLFLFGFGIARAEAVWAAVDRLLRPALILALAAYALIAASMLAFPDGLPAAFRPWRDALWAFDQWIWILALLGLARRHLNHDGRLRRFLTGAVFPFYILHQTAIVLLGHYLRGLGLSAGAEALILVAGTLVACLIGFEIVRRIRPLRPLFGLGPVAAAGQAAGPAAVRSAVP